MTSDVRTVPKASLPPGTLVAAGDYVVGNLDGEYFALSRWCSHRRGDLARGTLDREGCLVCPVHGARYDVRTGRAVDGPRVPGRGIAKLLMNRRPLRRATIGIGDGDIQILGSP